MAAYQAPTITVEWAPGFHPRNLPSSGDWQTLTIGGHTRLRGLSTKRGRQDDLDKFEPGTATLTLDNSDGQLDQSRSGSLTAGTAGLPGTPVRVTATDTVTATSREVFNGYTIDGWTPTYTLGAEGWVDLPCVDWLGWVAFAEMPGSAWAHWVADEEPEWWIRGESSESIGPLWFDSGSYGIDATSIGPPEAVSSIVPGGTTPSLLTGPTAAATASLAVGAVPSVTPDWTVAFWFKQDAGTGVRDLVRGTQGGVFYWGVRISTTGQLEAVMRDTSGGGIATATHTPSGGARYDDGAAHVVFVTFRRTAKQLVLRTELGTDTTSAWAGTAAPSGTQIEIGPVATTGQRPTIGDVAFWGRVVTHPAWTSGSPLLGPDFLWDNQAATTRIPKIVKVAGMGAPTVEYHTARSFNQLPESMPGTLAQSIRDHAEGVGGVAWMTRDGKLRFRDFDALTSGTYTAHYTTPVAHLTDEITPSGSAPAVRVSNRGRSGTRLDRVYNDIQFTTGTVAIRPSGSVAYFSHKYDATSIARYGRRRLSFGNELGLADQTMAEDIVDDALARYAEPPVEVSDLTIQPSASATSEAATFVIRDLELEKCVTYTESDHTGTVVLTGDFRIQREQWSWGDGTHWTVTVGIAPVGA